VTRFEEQAVVRADPAIIFSIYEDVENWCRWDTDVESAGIAGAFVSGTAGTLKPRNGPPVGMRLTEVDKNRSFTDETSTACPSPGRWLSSSGGSSGDRSSAGSRKRSNG